MLRLGATAFGLVTRPESLDSGEYQQHDQNPLRGERLHARVDAHRIHVWTARDHGNGHDVALLQLADSLPHEHERHEVEEDARDREEWPHWNAHAVAVEEREDHRQHREADDHAQYELEPDVRPLIEERL